MCKNFYFLIEKEQAYWRSKVQNSKMYKFQK